MTAVLVALATFQSLGLTWAPDDGAPGVACEVRYRAEGEAEWREGLPLWFDARRGEYRGSLVELRPGTAYEVEVALETGATATTTARTWSEAFPIARTVTIGEHDEPYEITEGGTAEGYVLYENGTIDAASVTDRDALAIRASYVIVRNVTTRGGQNAIGLYGAHDVVIEESDLSGWGRIASDGLAEDEWAGVRCRRDTAVERVVIQRNHIHHPRGDSNSWGEYRDDFGTAHPIGPMATHFDTCGGNHVIRYNRIESDDEHYFADGIGGADNFTDHGFPRNDTDIHGNHVSQCWDDAIESEGANENVRIWGNLLEHTYVAIATATTSIGPLYVFRNVFGESRHDPDGDPDSADHGPFMKTGGREPDYGGRIYVFHNTTLQPRGSAMYGLGAGGGITDSGAPLVENVVSRNNVFFIHKDWWASISDGRESSTNDFDFDLYNGEIQAYSGAEPNGIHAEPTFASDGISLASGSPGSDAAERLPGFNDRFLGAAPDVGAHELGAPAPEYGVDAYRGGTEPPPPIPGTDAGALPPGADGGTPMPGADAGPISRSDAGDSRALTGCGCTASPGAPLPLAWLLIVFSFCFRRFRPS